MTLITGDRVTVTPSSRVIVDPARGSERTGFEVLRDGEHVQVIPKDVAGLVGGVLDPALFDVTALIEMGYDDARSDVLPLIVRRAPAARRDVAPLRTGAALASIRADRGRAPQGGRRPVRRRAAATARREPDLARPQDRGGRARRLSHPGQGARGLDRGPRRRRRQGGRARHRRRRRPSGARRPGGRAGELQRRRRHRRTATATARTSPRSWPAPAPAPTAPARASRPAPT